MNRPITITETESVILKLHEMKVQDKMTSYVNSAKYFKEVLTLLLLNIFPKIAEEGRLSNSF